MNNYGFSLVELIVVIAIIAILVGVAVPVYSEYIEKAQTASDNAYLSDLKNATQVFAAENGFEIGSVSVESTVGESQGITLYLTDGTEYEGDLSALYEIIGKYEFNNGETDRTISFDSQSSSPEQTPEVSEDNESTGESDECKHSEKELVEEGEGYKKYKCADCGEEFFDGMGDSLGGT